MSIQSRYFQKWVASLTIVGLVAGPLHLPAAHAAQRGEAAAEVAVDGGWPRGYETPLGAQVIMYQPQIADWKDQAHMSAYAAISYLPKGEEEPALGTVKLEADTKVALDERLVDFSSLKIAEANFPSLEKEQTQDLVTEITKAIPEEDRVIGLDRVLAAIDVSQIASKNVEGVKADPPTVFASEASALLVTFDGEPVWSPIEGNTLRFAVNTNWDLFQEGTDGPLYLRNESVWLKSTALNGTWSSAGTLPDSFASLSDADWKDVKEAVPGKKLSEKNVPSVFVSNGPAELIVTNGAPKLEAVAGTSLLWVSNTESDLFRYTQEGPFYYLVAGRWFSSVTLNGPWVFATPDLPEDFTRIPADHPRARVLASVPGSTAAMEAVLLAQIPQTARVKISEVKAPAVVFQGAPQFEPISDTSLHMAVNTDKAIIKVGDLYYMCFQGVWFMATSPEGPWEVTKSVPGEIYTIPPSSPVHNVTYVTVEEDEDEEWVEFAAAAGYTGLMIAWGCAVWGTGYYYPPYVWYGVRYPVYYPRPVTYGRAAWYNPWTGRFGHATGVYGPYGGMGAAAVYNPHTGTYARGGVAYGPYGATGRAQVWNPLTETYGQTRQGSNVYASWGSTYVQRGDEWVSTKRYTNKESGVTTRVVRTDEGAALIRRGGEDGPKMVVKGDDVNVFAGQDGKVYRRGEDGSWQSWNKEGWKAADEVAPTLSNIPKDGSKPVKKTPATRPAQLPAPNVQLPPQRPVIANPPAQPVNPIAQQPGGLAGQLDRDVRARQAGAQRTRDFSNYRGANAGPGIAQGNRPAHSGNRAGGGIGGGRGGGGGRR